MNFPLVFANPWGALGLLGIPAVIAIHCLQRKSKVLRISTLFLLERIAPSSKEGRRFTWLRHSLPFWLQIVSVLVMTWLLMQPRWMAANTVQQAMLVLDSSISMRAFTPDLVARVSPKLNTIAALAPRTYWMLRETDPSRPTLYEGFSLPELEKKMAAWTPALLAHDPTHALELARSLAPRDALVALISDRPHEVPNGIDLITVGEPIENCGLVGSHIKGTNDDLHWEVMAQNYGKQAVHRQWWIELAGNKTEPQTLDLEPGHAQVLKGKFPPGLDRLEICLAPDRFALDDRMALVRPQPKLITVEPLGDDATMDLFTRLMQTVPSLALVQAGAQADLSLRTLDPKSPTPGSAVSSVVIYNAHDDKTPPQGGPFSVENDPLNQDLNWQGLVFQPITAPPASPDDRVLVWKDNKPVILVHNTGGGHRQLVFNFNFAQSNAARLPAFVLLVSRFVDTIRQDKKAPETLNAELTEPIIVAADPAKGPVILRDSTSHDTSTAAASLMTIHAPGEPGFFTIKQGDETLVTGAAQFGDARESDFSTATTSDTLAGHRATLVEQRTRADAWVPLWLLLIGLLLGVYWYATRVRIA